MHRTGIHTVQVPGLNIDIGIEVPEMIIGDGPIYNSHIPKRVRSRKIFEVEIVIIDAQRFIDKIAGVKKGDRGGPIVKSNASI
jgi:hypothetical protein